MQFLLSISREEAQLKWEIDFLHDVATLTLEVAKLEPTQPEECKTRPFQQYIASINLLTHLNTDFESDRNDYAQDQRIGKFGSKDTVKDVGQTFKIVQSPLFGRTLEVKIKANALFEATSWKPQT